MLAYIPYMDPMGYYIDLHPYSALVQFFEVQEEGVGVGKWRLQEAKLTVLLNLAELQRLQAVLAAAVLLREAGAPSCRGFSFSKYSAFLSWCSPCSPSCVRNLTCWHNPAHGWLLDYTWTGIDLDLPSQRHPASQTILRYHPIAPFEALYFSCTILALIRCRNLRRCQTRTELIGWWYMMVPHWAILPSNRSYCIGNLDKALRHPHQGNDCKRPHLDFENPACQYVFQWALWISFSARTMLRSKGKPRESITPSAVPWGPSFLLIDIAATWRSGARGEARAALERSFCHCFSLFDLYCVHAMSIFNLGPVLACVCRNLHVATNLYGIWNAWIIHLWKSYAIPFPESPRRGLTMSYVSVGV